jgi:HSP20 family molecular chaperone IbpA
MADLSYRLAARIDSDNPAAARAVLQQLFPAATIVDDQGELVVEAELAGASAKELNRSLLSALRRAEKKTRLRAQWTSPDGTIERYFDYVLKKVIPSQ